MSHQVGMKWIASFPDNVGRGAPRASAVLLLNDYDTGYPFACLEAGGISAARTAASAACATSVLLEPRTPVSVSFVGAGVIARTICDYLHEAGVGVTDAGVHDLDPASAEHLVGHAAGVLGVPVRRCDSLLEALKRDVVVFATTAAAPYVPADVELRAGQLLLNISLRDLAPELLLANDNVVDDDVEHCLKAQTSPHLAEQLSGSREFVTGTLAAALRGEVKLDQRRATIFSPFGLGVLDIAVGSLVLEAARARGAALEVPGYFGEPTRW
ncbi:MAG: 2,3-diaminopropionate biosynthesis protein SbnB [Actinomycetota bacterium]|nr:2,3-diaminopropionate biosynthesis protein SbnB [Actinomycetota bacterium]